MYHDQDTLAYAVFGGIAVLILVIGIIWMRRRSVPLEPLPDLFVDRDPPPPLPRAPSLEEQLEKVRQVLGFTNCRYGSQVVKRVAGTLDLDRIADVSHHIGDCLRCLELAIRLKRFKEGRDEPATSPSGARQR